MIHEKCNCRFCQLSNRIDKVKLDKNTEDLIKMVDELAGLYLNESFDNDYNKAVLNGDWPTAQEQLERALENAKNKSLKWTRY